MPINKSAIKYKWGNIIKHKNKLYNHVEGYLFISPWLIGLVIFSIGPMIGSIFMAFTENNFIKPAEWVGLNNFKKIFTNDQFFWNSLYVTFKFVFIREPLKILIALCVALLLNSINKASGLFRTLMYFPTIFGSGVAVAIMWKKFFASDGMANAILATMGISPVKWVNSTELALYTVILTGLIIYGSAMIIFLSGLKSIPDMLYESAVIDGAGWFKKLTHITIPMITPVIFFNLIMGIISGFQSFTTAFIMTDPPGGPMNATRLYMLNLYDYAFQYHKFGYASALAWILFIIILIFTLMIFKSSDMWVFYETNLKMKKKKRDR